MKFEHPLFVICLTGNKRDECSQLSYVCFASYQQSKDQTVVFVKANPLNREQRKNLSIDLVGLFSKTGDVESCQYFKDGAEVFMLSES